MKNTLRLPKPLREWLNENRGKQSLYAFIVSLLWDLMIADKNKPPEKNSEGLD